MTSGGTLAKAAICLSIGAAASLLAPAALAAKAAPWSPERVATALAQRYGVSVLHVRKVIDDGRLAYEVVVMNPGGNFNEAYQVNTLEVDAATGELIPQFRHRADGYDLPGALKRSPPDDGGRLLRRMSGEGH
jgi:hypothetical protein